MPFVALHAVLALAAPLLQDQVVPPPPRLPLPRPVASAPVAEFNQNRVPGGTARQGHAHAGARRRRGGVPPEGEHDPVVRILAFAEPGKAPQVPGPLLRAPVGTTVRLTVRNRSDSALTFGGFRRSLKADDDTVQLAADATREITFRLDTAGNFFYWGALKGCEDLRGRDWLDSQLTGAFVVDPAGRRSGEGERDLDLHHHRVVPRRIPTRRPSRSALTFNGKAWPYNERLTFTQGDSVHLRFINAAAVEHPLHLHGFYFRVTRHGGARGDTRRPAVAAAAAEHADVVPIGGSLSLAFLPTTPGNWVFHCHFARHVGEIVSLHGSPDPYTVQARGRRDDRAMPGARYAGRPHDARPGHRHARHAGAGLQGAGRRRPAHDPALSSRSGPMLSSASRPPTAIVLQTGDVGAGERLDHHSRPGARAQARRAGAHPREEQPGRARAACTGTGSRSRAIPTACRTSAAIGDKIMPPIPPGESFAAEFTPPRSGTFPYHSHLHEMRQIGSGMYGAIIVTDAPRDTTRDHVIVAGGGGLPVFYKTVPPSLLVNGRRTARPIRMTVGDTNRLRIVSIHSDEMLDFRLRRRLDGRALEPARPRRRRSPDALRKPTLAQIEMGPGQTADFLFLPQRVGELVVEVWIAPTGQRVLQPIIVDAAKTEERGIADALVSPRAVEDRN